MFSLNNPVFRVESVHGELVSASIALLRKVLGNEDATHTRVDVSSQLLQGHTAEGDDFLFYIVTGDANWLKKQLLFFNMTLLDLTLHV